MTRKFFILLLSYCLFCGCSDNKNETTNSEKNPVLNESVFRILKGTWTEVELRDGDWVIYQPCDDAIFTIDIKKLGSRHFLNIGWGQEQESAFIKTIREGDGRSIVLTARDTSDTYNIELIYKPIDNRSEWAIEYPGKDTGHKKQLIRTKDTSNYKRVIQPCHECWDFCDSLGQKATSPNSR